MLLSDDQQRFFHLFGYLVLRGALRQEILWIDEEFERQVARPETTAVPFIDQSPRLAMLLDHPAITGPVSSLLGADFNYMSSDGGVKRSDTAWHSDGHWTEHGALQKIKILVYLDVLDANSGCLRVIPGSHRVGEGYAEALEPLAWEGMRGGRPLAIDQEQWPNIALDVRPGDLIIFNHHLKHAAFHSGIRRRLFTLIFVEQARTPTQLTQLRQYLAFHLSAWGERPYGQPMLDTASPERMVHLRQGLDHQDAITAARLAAAAR